jgi:prepilin peptidase CpaA
MATCRLILLCIFAVAAVYFDFRFRLVPNWLVLTCLACGTTLALIGGLAGCFTYGLGVVMGFLLLLPAFIFNMVGGGDVKSLAVIGLLTGPRLLWVSFLRGSLLAGAVALIMIAARHFYLALSPASRGCNAELLSSDRTGIPYAAILALAAASSVLF